MKADVTSEPEWVALIAKAVLACGRLDILVNNAAISGSSVSDSNGVEGRKRIIAVNQASVFLGTKLAAEQMAKTGAGQHKYRTEKRRLLEAWERKLLSIVDPPPPSIADLDEVRRERARA